MGDLGFGIGDLGFGIGDLGFGIGESRPNSYHTNSKLRYSIIEIKPLTLSIDF